MTPRRFSIGLMIAAGALFLGTAFANVLFDPVGVFGTDFVPYRYPNYRYLGLRQYQRERTSVDAMLFASSRGFFVDQKLLAQRIGAAKLFNGSVPYGLITDHEPFLEYVLRDKASRGETLKTVVLLVDTDLLGKQPWTNTNIDCFLPPELKGGDSPARFWWRYLTSFQPDNWREAIERAHAHLPNPDPTSVRSSGLGASAADAIRLTNAADEMTASAVTLRLAGLSSGSLSGLAKLLVASPRVVSVSNPLPPDRGAPDPRFRGQWIVSRPDIERQFAMIEAFVRLCRDYGVKLIVATTPLKRDNIGRYLPGELESIGDRLNRIADVWDFATPGPVTDRADVWLDYSHFKPEIGTMMLTRMFGGDGEVLAGFGTFRPKTVR